MCKYENKLLSDQLELHLPSGNVAASLFFAVPRQKVSHVLYVAVQVAISWFCIQNNRHVFRRVCGVTEGLRQPTLMKPSAPVLQRNQNEE